MRVLVAIANHGTKNRQHLQVLLEAYRAVRFDVTVVVMSDAPKRFDPEVEVLTGTPIPDPRSLPYAHRQLFAERVDDYDVFIYSEDDTLVTQRHIEAFLEVNEQLDPSEIPGFMRYEQYPDGEASYCSIHSGYYWDPGSVRAVGNDLFARFTNDHGACYMVTQRQLRAAIASGGFLVEPQSGRYSMMVSAGTDIYTQCGFERLVCLTRLEDFLLYHLPNVYLGTLGIRAEDLQPQLEALRAIARGEIGSQRAFETESRLPTVRWDKKYYERPFPGLKSLVPAHRSEVLSVGCGAGDLESSLFGPGSDITAIPLDGVIAATARRRGINTLPPDFDEAFRLLDHRKFDCILVADVLPHLEDPVVFLERLARFLADNGTLVATAPNMRHYDWKQRIGRPGPPLPQPRSFPTTALHPTDRSVLASWLRAAGYEVRRARFDRSGPLPFGRAPVLGDAFGRTVGVAGSRNR